MFIFDNNKAFITVNQSTATSCFERVMLNSSEYHSAAVISHREAWSGASLRINIKFTDSFSLLRLHYCTTNNLILSPGHVYMSVHGHDPMIWQVVDLTKAKLDTQSVTFSLLSNTRLIGLEDRLVKIALEVIG